MGAWGPAIFSSDAALDARGEWRDGLLDREHPERLSARMVAAAPARDDVEWWTGLALAQHETGHLQGGVRDHALALIDAGGDLDLWKEDGASSAARERALARLAEKLRGPRPKPTRLRGPRHPAPDPGVEAGDVVQITAGGRTAYFAVLEITGDGRRYHDPALLGLHWPHPGIPEDPAGVPYLSGDPHGDPRQQAEDAAAVHPFALTLSFHAHRDPLDPEIGRVVARGVEFPFDGVGHAWIDGGWAWLADQVASPAHAERERRSEARIARFGADPAAWMTFHEQEEMRRMGVSTIEERSALIGAQLEQLRAEGGEPFLGEQTLDLLLRKRGPLDRPD